MSNDGLRISIDRHGGDLHWTVTEHGEQYVGRSRGANFETAGHDIDQYL